MLPRLYFKQAHVFEAQHDDEVVFKVAPDIEHQHMFGLFSTQDQYAGYILQNPLSTCQELLYGACHTFLDLDSKHNSLADLGFETESSFIEQFNTFLIAKFKEYLDVTIKSKHIHWSCSSRQDKKLSYHVVIRTEDWYWPSPSAPKQFVHRLSSDSLDIIGFYFLEERKKELQRVSLIDKQVNSKNRCMRTVGCCKFGSDTPLLPLNKKLTYMTVLNSLITIPTVSDRTEFTFETAKEIIKVPKQYVNKCILEQLADKYDVSISEVKGSLIICRNKGIRHCPIANEVNETDNSYFCLKNDGCIYYGCHSETCEGKLLKVHEAERSTYKFYENYEDVLKIHKEIGPDQFSRSVVEQYLCDTVSFIDDPSDPRFHTWSEAPVHGFNNQLIGRRNNSSKSLFFRYSDIHLPCADDVLKFSEVLQNLVRSRRLKTYRAARWIPYAKTSKYSPKIPTNVLNTFEGYALETVVPKKEIDFTETKIYQLLKRNLTNNCEASFKYLCSYIALKCQKSWFKIPTALCFVAAEPGIGKTSFTSSFLKLLFSSSSNTVVTFNRLSSFISPFNLERSRCIWISLEEVKGGLLREFDSILKTQVTASEMLLEAKGKDRISVPFYGQIVINSNESRVLRIDRNDRRYCLFETISKKDLENPKEWFDKLYEEFDCIDTMKSAWDWFINYDISKFDYTKYPKTKLLHRIMNMSDQLEHRFIRFLWKEYLPHSSEYTFTEEELFFGWTEFCQNHGCKVKRERAFVTSTFELCMNATSKNDTYHFTHRQVKKKLRDLFGFDIFCKSKK